MEGFEKQPSLPLFLFAFFLLLPASSLAHSEHQPYGYCFPHLYECGRDVLNISYPFWTDGYIWPDGYLHRCSRPEKHFKIACNETDESFEIEMQSRKYNVKKIGYENQTLTVVDKDFFAFESIDKCLSPYNNTTLDFNFFNYTVGDLIFTFLHNCTPDVHNCPPDSEIPHTHPGFKPHSCLPNSYFTLEPEIPKEFEDCQVVKIPILKEYWHRLDISPELNAEAAWKEALTNGFNITWSPIDPKNQCGSCVRSNGYCGSNDSFPNKQPICYCNGQPQAHTCPPQGVVTKKHKVIIVASAAVGGILICAIICFIFFWFFRKRLISSVSSKQLSHSLSSDPPLRSDFEKNNSLYITHFFEYRELEEATNNFDPSNELGDGGFGIVYHGKLRDGRNVAVKRLYENTCRCQFKNEIKILSQLRHQNLVTLYGCSSRHSRELLLVYEFIPNGTVADHLHGDRAKPGALIWPTRMCIAMETADALKYLHAVEIIHRDVKTNNILLDNNFHVKVADFGLSRLFPTNVSHISTAPQGTPGYVDPDYHRCYQLTDKSDVYSFGVVLIELISSKPAVDVTRHPHEINLAHMALNRIHNSALNELVDPSLGFDSNHGVRRMITSVAELAFRCLQDEKESRPSMEEVLEHLRGIESEEYNVEKVEVNTEADDEALLKKMLPLSPETITDAWESKTTTPSTSG